MDYDSWPACPVLFRDINKESADEERGSERTRFVKDAQRPYSHPYYWAPFILMGNCQ